ncbi:MAG: hypothetical protein AAF587_29540 [Bacteroidota bacterium]
MKKFSLIFLGIVALIWVAIITLGAESAKPIPPNEMTEAQASMIETLLEEAKVKQASLTTDGTLYLSTEDDGTIRDGLAEYFCEMVQDVNKIIIVEYLDQEAPHESKHIGQSICIN